MSTPTAAGFVAIAGLPNVGKSTLLNGLVGERLSIVTAKAQTTRQRLLGIYTDEGHQAVFVDTPGLLEPRYLLQRGMLEDAELAVSEADLVVYVADAGYEASLAHAKAWSPGSSAPRLLCLNKVDRLPGGDATELASRLEGDGRWATVIPTVATTGTGIAKLRAAILARLPEGPFLYPPDDLATAPLRFFAAELVREACFEALGQELPYSIAVGIEEFREAAEPLYIAATIYVERESQKGMVIGRGGTMIRGIGSAARGAIERLVDRRVYLDLRVKVLRNWRRDPARLKLLGYPVPSRRG